MKQLLAVILFIFFQLYAVHAQLADASPANKAWNAQWIAAPNDNGTEYGVYYFRKQIDLAAKPSSFIVHISADNRYKLFVNDSLISIGPARGDLNYWNYETIDLAQYLMQGKNTVAALVWNEADHRPEAQVSFRTAFIVQGDDNAAEILNTDKTWKCLRDASFKPIPMFYFAASTGQLVDMNDNIQDWQMKDFDDSNWPNAATLFEGKLKGMSDGFGWMLVPSILPARELTYQRINVLRKADGLKIPGDFPSTNKSFTVPANTTVTLLLDQTYLTNAYVTLQFSKGKDAGVSLGYAESLFDNIAKYGMRKSNRNDVEGKDFSGEKDSIISSGKNDQSFTTLNFRTYRYIQMIIHTQDSSLTIDDLYGTFTGYPFKQTAVFNTNNTEIKNILDIGWRTARLNAFETYTDCPYYEQLQYIGDTRIQAMVSYYCSGDDRLARNALNLMDHSRLPEGVTLSRYPTHSTQIISTFSLWYIGMLHDYWMYRNDSNFIKDKLIGERDILNFFSKYQQQDGSLKNTPYWTFVDWANGKDWSVGSPPKGADGASAIIDLQLLWAYEWAAKMEANMGLPVYEKLYNQKIAQLKVTIQRKYWDPVKMLYADTESKTLFSQHANALAILTGMANEKKSKLICDALLTDKTLTHCTIYFKYYLHMALVKGGYGND
ncbi:MAG: alpha-L-rhamnosidase N-terminal domain-containing protein, partial [Parafilimonas sp.]